MVRIAMRALGLIVMVTGALAIGVSAMAVAFLPPSDMIGAAVGAALGVLLFAIGYLLVRVGAVPTEQGVGEWTLGWFRRWGLVVFEVLAGGLCVVLAVGAIDILTSGGDPAEAGTPLAVIPLVVLGLVALEMNRRGASTGAQYLVVGTAFGSFGIVLIVFGITGEDVGRLVLGSVAALSGLASSVAAGRS